MKTASVFAIFLAFGATHALFGLQNNTASWPGEGAVDSSDCPPFTPVFLCSHANFTVMAVAEDTSLFEGDIVLNDHQKLAVLGLDKAVEALDDERNLRKNPNYLWPNSVIPYKFTEGDYTAKEVEYIEKWLAELSTVSCVKFVPWTDQRDFVRIYSGSGCFSNVGRQSLEQTLSLTRYVNATTGHCIFRSIVVHEFLHAAGFWHEHTRLDRDDYLNIFWDNVDPKQMHNFNKVNTKFAQTIGKYDYVSVMQYSATSFSKNGKATMARKDGGTQLGPDATGTVTSQDIDKLKALYKCGTVTPAPEGCLDFEQAAEACATAASQGACTDEKYKAQMTLYCKKSCNIC